MKNYLFFLWVCFALLFGCIACSDDDKEEKDLELSGIVKTVKYVDESEEDVFIDNYEFSYDSEMRLTKICNRYPFENKEAGFYEDTLYFSYAANKVTAVKGWRLHHVVSTPEGVVSEYWENIRDTFVYNLKDGRAQYCEMENNRENYEYDGTVSNLILARDSYGTTSFVWKDGNMIKRTDESYSEGADIYEYDYLPEVALNNTNIDLNPLFSTLLTGSSDDIEYGFWVGVLGNRCKNLVSSKEYSEKLTYEMKGKYITKIVGESYYMEIEYAK